MKIFRYASNCGSEKDSFAVHTDLIKEDILEHFSVNQLIKRKLTFAIF